MQPPPLLNPLNSVFWRWVLRTKQTNIRSTKVGKYSYRWPCFYLVSTIQIRNIWPHFSDIVVSSSMSLSQRNPASFLSKCLYIGIAELFMREGVCLLSYRQRGEVFWACFSAVRILTWYSLQSIQRWSVPGGPLPRGWVWPRLVLRSASGEQRPQRRSGPGHGDTSAVNAEPLA